MPIAPREIGVPKVTLASIKPWPAGVGFRGFGFSPQRSLQKRHGLFGMGFVIVPSSACASMICISDGFVVSCTARRKRRNGFGGFAGFKQSLALESWK